MAERRNPSQHSPEVGSALDDETRALRELLQDALKDFQPEFGATLDIPQITVRAENVPDVCRIVKDEPGLSFKLLLCLAGADYPEHFQVVYILLSLEHEHKLVIKANVAHDDPHVPTVTQVWRAADWYEREAHDLFGIVFDGHPNLKPLILYEGFEGYPGRKEHPFHDYQEY